MTEQTLRLYLVRHGITIWNRDLRMQGHTDVPLEEEGWEQARRIASRLAVTAPLPEVVWASDLSRARQTAEAIAAPLGLEVQTTPLLRETMLGEWEGLSRADIVARGEEEHLERYRLDPVRCRPPGGETLEAAWERMCEAVAHIREQHPTGAVTIVGHGGTLRVLLCDALEAPIHSMQRFWLDNASLSVLDEIHTPQGTLRRVALVNDTSHLRDVL